jgi:Uma2 family endonuclease
MTATPTAPTHSTTTITADEFVARYGRHRMELNKGYPTVLPMPGARHGKVCATLARLLGNHVADKDLRHVLANDTFIQTSTAPDTVRGADLCYVPYDRLPRDQVPDGVLQIAPDLVIEVRSPSDRWSDLIIKVGEFLKFGVRAVIVIDAPTESASVFRDQDDWQQIFHNGDELTVPDVLPGFSVRVHQLFE